MTPLEEMWIRDVETIKVIADQRRLKILELFNQPQTVKEIATAIELPPSKLYYHINLLEKHGLIEVVDHNLDSGIVEKIYQATARQFKLVNPLLQRNTLSHETTEALLLPLLDQTRTNFSAALAAESAETGEPPRHPFFSKRGFHLSDDQLTVLHQKLVHLIEEVTAIDALPQPENEPYYELTVVFYQHKPAPKEKTNG